MHLPLVLLSTLACTVLAAADAEIPKGQFRDGQRIVFFGDSLTHGGTYHAWMQLFYATRFPERRIRCYNAGIGGATVASSLGRLDSDALALKPDVVFVLFGMNDVNRDRYKTAEVDEAGKAGRERALTGFRTSLGTLLDRIAASGASAMVATPMPYDQYHQALKTPNFVACNDGLVRISSIAGEVAKAHGIQAIDLHGPMTALLQKLPDYMPAQDRVHPNTTGHLVATYWLLLAQGVPGTVARLQLDAATGKAMATERCTVEAVTRDGAAITCTYRPQALPFPTSPDYEKAAALVPWGELNREILQVANLPAGSYSLSSGTVELGRFSAAEFAAGVDIARLDTPQQRQAQLIRTAVLRKIAADVPLRSVAKIDGLMRDNRIDPADRAAADPFLDAFPAKSSSKAYYEIEIATYRKNRDRLDEARKELEDAFTAIHALQVVPACPIAIRPVK